MVDDSAFRDLRNQLSKFNFFEAVDIVRREVSHSAALAFLFHPGQNHGLEDAALRGLLKKIFATKTLARSVVANLTEAHPAPTIPEILNWRFPTAIAMRELSGGPNRIDVLVVDNEHRLVVLVENKIDSSEHSDQLSRYWNWAEHRYPGYAQIGIYLTPRGDAPSDKRWIPMPYDWMDKILQGVRPEAIKNATLPTGESDVVVFLDHYLELLRRHVVSNKWSEEVKRLCDELYGRYPGVFDMVFENRPNPQQMVVAQLNHLVISKKDLVLKTTEKHLTYPKFTTKVWETLTNSVEPMPSGADAGAFYFEFNTGTQKDGFFVRIALNIGPYRENLKARSHLQCRILEIVRQSQATAKAQGDKSIFNGSGKATKPNPNATTLYSKTWIPRKEFRDMLPAKQMEAIQNHWAEFCAKDKDFESLCDAFDVAALKTEVATIKKATKNPRKDKA